MNNPINHPSQSAIALLSLLTLSLGSSWADVLFEDIDYTATGSAQLSTSPNGLQIQGLDNSGEDGFTAVFDPALKISFATDYNSSRSNKQGAIKQDDNGDAVEDFGLIVSRTTGTDYEVRPSFERLSEGSPLTCHFITPDGRLVELGTMLTEDTVATFTLPESGPQSLVHEFSTFDPDETGETAFARDSARVLFPSAVDVTFEGRTFKATGVGFSTRLNRLDCGHLIGLSSVITINEGEGGSTVSQNSRENGFFLDGAHGSDINLPVIYSSQQATLPQPPAGDSQKRQISLIKRLDKSSPLLAKSVDLGRPASVRIEARGRFFGDEQARPLGVLTCETRNQGLHIGYDYRGLPGVAGASVEIYARGQKLDTIAVSGTEGVAARLSSLTGEDAPLFRSCEKLGGGFQTPCYLMTFPDGVVYQQGDEQTAIDEIRILTSGFSGQLEEVEEIQFSYDNLAGDLVFTPPLTARDEASPRLTLTELEDLSNHIPESRAGHFVPGHVTVLKRAEVAGGGASTGGDDELIYLTLPSGGILPSVIRQVMGPDDLVFAHPLPLEDSEVSFHLAGERRKSIRTWKSAFEQILPTRPAIATMGRPLSHGGAPSQALPARATSASSQAYLALAQENRITLEVPENAPSRATVDVHAGLLIGEGDEQVLVTLVSEDTNVICLGNLENWKALIGDIVLCGLEELLDLEEFQLSISSDGHVSVLKRSTNAPVPLSGSILVSLKDQDNLPELTSAKISRNWNDPHYTTFGGIKVLSSDLLGGSQGNPDGSGGLLAVGEWVDKSSPILYRSLNFSGNTEGVVLSPQLGEPKQTPITDLTLTRVETDEYPWVAAISGVVPLGRASEHHGLGFPGNKIAVTAPAPSGTSKKGYDYYSASVQDNGQFVLDFPTEDLPENVVAQITIGELTEIGEQCPDPTMPDCVLIEDYSAMSSGPVLLQGMNSLADLQLRIPEIIRCGFPGWKTKLQGDSSLVIWRDDSFFNPEKTQLMLTFTQIEEPSPAPVLAIPGKSSYRENDTLSAMGVSENTLISHGGTQFSHVALVNEQLITRSGIARPDGGDNTVITDTGLSHSGYIYPAVSGVTVPHPGQVFVGRIDRRTTSEQTIPRESTAAGPGVRYFFSGVDDSGNPEPCILIDQEWCVGAVATLNASFELSDGTVISASIPEIIFEQEGSNIDCVEKLLDIARCGITQLNGDPTGLGWRAVPQADESVKLEAYPLNPDLTLIGKISLCVSCPQETEIVSVEQKDCFRKGDTICFEMTGISPDPDQLCVMLNTTPPVALNVTDVLTTTTDGVFKVTATIEGAPETLTAAQLCVTSGQGRRPQWSPMVDVTVANPGTVWFGQSENMIKSRDRIVIKPEETEPPVTEICLYDDIQGDETALCFDLTGPYPTGTQVKLSGHLYIEQADGGNLAYDIQEPVVTTLQGSTAEDMCHVLADLIRCQLATAGFMPDLELKCPDDGDDDPNTATFKVCYTGVDGTFRGYLKIVLCLPSDDPVVDGTGNDNPVDHEDTIVITGCNFGDEAKNVHVIATGAAGSFPLTVLMVSDKKIVASTGSIPADLAGAELDIQVTVGQGNCKPITLAGDHVISTPVTGFSNPGGGNTGTLVGGLTVKPELTPASLKTQLVATLDEFGQVVLPFDEDWSGALIGSVHFSGFINDDPTQVVAFEIPRIDFPTDGTAQECAIFLMQAISSAMIQSGLSPNLNVGVAGPQIALYLTNPGYPTLEPLDAELIICLERLPELPVITRTPSRIKVGESFLVEGSFPAEAREYLAFAKRGNVVVPMAVESLDGSGLTLRAMSDTIDNDCDGDVDFELFVAIGGNDSGDAIYAFDGIRVGSSSSTYLPSASHFAKAPEPIVICPADEPETKQRFMAQIEDGAFCLYLRGDWVGDDPISIAMQAQTECDTFSFSADDVSLGGDGSALDCAERLKDVIRCAFIQQTGVGVHIECHPIAGSNTVKLTFQLASEKPILNGCLAICANVSTEGDDADADGDGLTNAQETANNTNALDPDSDNDGVLDGTEVANGTNPLRADSDGDGASDFDELLAGTDPMDPASRLVLEIDPAAADADESMAFSFCVPDSVQDIIYELKVIDLETGNTTELPGMIDVGNGGELFFEIGIEEALTKDFFIVTAR